METAKLLNEAKKAFKPMVTHESICDDKEEMTFLVDAFAISVSYHFPEDETIERIGTVKELLKFFDQYLDHSEYHLQNHHFSLHIPG